MNPRAHKIVKELEAMRASHGLAGVIAPSHQNPLIAELQVIVAEEQEKSAAKLERFTCWLIYFTIALVFIGIIQIIIMFCKP
jgi:hypothetical protein